MSVDSRFLMTGIRREGPAGRRVTLAAVRWTAAEAGRRL